MNTNHAVKNVLCDNFVGSQSYLNFNATGIKYYIHRDSTCSKPYVVYMAYCKKCKSNKKHDWTPLNI